MPNDFKRDGAREQVVLKFSDPLCKEWEAAMASGNRRVQHGGFDWILHGKQERHAQFEMVFDLREPLE